MKQVKMLITIITAAAFLLGGCAGGGVETSEKTEEPIKVYTSFYAMEDFTKTVGGDGIEIVNMVPSGMEPHDYEPSAKEIAMLRDADVFIYSGAGMEHWVDSILSTLSRDTVVVNASTGISLEDIDDDKESNQKHHGDKDPHVWLNPVYASIEAENICNGLIEADPTNKTTYHKNLEKFQTDLTALAEKYKTTLANKKQDELIVTHEAFGYLCDFIDMDQVGIEGIQGDTEPSAAKMAEIIEKMKKDGIHVIFAEEADSDKVAQSIAQESGAEVLTLNTFEGDSQNRDYITVMEDNLQKIEKAAK